MDFFIQNWQFFVIIFILILSAINSFLKKTKTIDCALLSTFEILPSLIIDAEKLFGSGNGQNKFNWVLSMASAYYESLNGQMSDSILVSLSQAIEKILATPTKK